MSGSCFCVPLDVVRVFATDRRWIRGERERDGRQLLAADPGECLLSISTSQIGVGHFPLEWAIKEGRVR